MIAWIPARGGMNVPNSELRLGFSDGDLVFSDGGPFCLVCGRRPFRSRIVSFKDNEYAERQAGAVSTVLETIHPMLGGLNKLRMASFSFAAPLCLLHYWRGRFLELTATVLYVLTAISVVVLYFLDLLPVWFSAGERALKGVAVGFVVLGAILFLRRSGTREILPCEVRRGSKTDLILIYNREAPRRR